MGVIFYDFPAAIAASLRFSGILFVLDGIEILGEDLPAVLAAWWGDPHCEVLLAWPSTLPVARFPFPGGVAFVDTVGMLSQRELEREAGGIRLPRYLRCGGERFPLEIFMGCPGYLALVLSLVRSLKSPPFSTMVSLHGEGRHSPPPEQPYDICIEEEGAREVLSQMNQFVSAFRQPIPSVVSF
ncbi:unnamed protein product [Phytomonas sp. EM1]|nr:unnamed protein product [Phytomonas sp. EM1]|eukprot:CCW62488.1 unnamed protein product [Phytomonas sp. isolate EM1]